MRAVICHKLDRAIGYVYQVGQHFDRTQDDVESRTLALRILALAKTDATSLDRACQVAYGCNYDRFTTIRNYERRQLWLATIPDYDASLGLGLRDLGHPASSRMDPGRACFEDENDAPAGW
jgi:hypothetical protein